MPTPITLSSPDITQAEIDAVVDVLHGNTLSIGPKIEEFERACAKVAGRKHGIGVSSGTAGLHCAMLASGIKPGDEVTATALPARNGSNNGYLLELHVADGREFKFTTEQN